MQAVAYLRCSTSDQALSPEAQLSAIEAWARQHGAHISSVHTDLGVSGAAEVTDRPGLLEALGELDKGSVLVVAKRDRLARDVIIAATVERLVESKGARVVSADGLSAATGPEGALLRAMVDAFSAYERALIRTRTKSALAVKKARGERVGGLPIGYTSSGAQLVPDVEEQAALERIRELAASGFSLRSIARELDAEGFKARGARWHPATVARLVRVA